MLSPAALSILMSTFREGTPRAHALAAWGAVGGAGAAVGVLLGGALTELVGWQAIFLINVPVGLGLAVAARRLIARRPGRTAAGADSTFRGAALATDQPRRDRLRALAGRRRRLDLRADGPRRAAAGLAGLVAFVDRRAPRHPAAAAHRPPRRPRRRRRPRS